MNQNKIQTQLDSKYISQFLLSILLLVGVLKLFREIMLVLETQRGQVISDPILKVFGPFDFSTPIFFLTYLPLLAGIALIGRRPLDLINFTYSYGLLQIFRLSTIYFSQLAPPPTMIDLVDPISNDWVFGQVIRKDLFFSGHVSAIWLVSLYLTRPSIRRLFQGIAVLNGVLLIGQHVHYSFDVLAAPFFAWASYKLIWHATAYIPRKAME